MAADYWTFLALDPNETPPYPGFRVQPKKNAGKFLEVIETLGGIDELARELKKVLLHRFARAEAEAQEHAIGNANEMLKKLGNYLHDIGYVFYDSTKTIGLNGWFDMPRSAFHNHFRTARNVDIGNMTIAQIEWREEGSTALAYLYDKERNLVYSDLVAYSYGGLVKVSDNVLDELFKSKLRAKLAKEAGITPMTIGEAARLYQKLANDLDKRDKDSDNPQKNKPAKIDSELITKFFERYRISHHRPLLAMLGLDGFLDTNQALAGLDVGGIKLFNSYKGDMGTPFVVEFQPQALGFIRKLLSSEYGLPTTTAPLRAFRDMLPLYFASLSIDEKFALMKGMLKLDVNASDGERFLWVLKHSPPAVQKLFQLYGQDIKDKELRSAAKKTHNELEPIPYEVVRGIIESNWGHSPESLFVSFNPKPSYVATVGQIHDAKFKVKSGDVIDLKIKIKKPGYEESVNVFFDKMNLICPASTHDVLEQLRQILLNEGDLSIEAKSIAEFGPGYTNAELGLSVVEIPSSERLPAKKDVLALIEVRGRPIGAIMTDRSLEQDALLKVYMKLALGFKHWLLRLFSPLRDQRIHADPHPGNLYYNLDHDRLTYLDFGNVGRVPRSEAELLLSIAGAVSMGQDQLEYLVDLLEKANAMMATPQGSAKPFSESIKNKLQHRVGPELLRVDAPVMEKIQNIIGIALDEGVKTPESFTLALRGALLWERNLIGVRSRLEEIDPSIFSQRPELVDLGVDQMLTNVGLEIAMEPAPASAGRNRHPGEECETLLSRGH